MPHAVESCCPYLNRTLMAVVSMHALHVFGWQRTWGASPPISILGASCATYRPGSTISLSTHPLYPKKQQLCTPVWPYRKYVGETCVSDACVVLCTVAEKKRHSNLRLSAPTGWSGRCAHKLQQKMAQPTLALCTACSSPSLNKNRYTHARKHI